MTTICVRVIYRPRGTRSGMWAYGWVFASDSMSRAWDTLRRVGDWRKWEYRAEKVHPGDFDHPKNREVLGKRDPAAIHRGPITARGSSLPRKRSRMPRHPAARRAR